MKFLNKNYLIILIFILAFLLRIFNVTGDPPSLNWDEASLGYNSYSILKTDKDEWGKTMPLTFEAFGDFKLPGYIYTLVPFIAVFGLNEFAVRLPSVLIGGLSVVFLFLIVNSLTGNKKIALLASFLMAVSPWHFFLSRIALEANLALGFFIIGLYLLIRGARNSAYLIPASLLFGISIFTYNSARIFIPLFLICTALVYRKKIKINKNSIISLIIFGLFLALGFYLAVFQDSSARYYWVRILDEGAINFLEQARNNSNLNPLVTNLIYNKYSYFIYNFTLNYLKHFSLQFLGLSGGNNYQFSIQNMGQMYLVELPFLVWGLFQSLRKKSGFIFVIWFLLAPIPSALTRESPHALRSVFMIGSIQMLTAYGFFEFVNLLKNRKFFVNFTYAIAGFFIAFNIFFYFKNYFYEYPVKYSEAWQYGYKQVVQNLNNNYDNYPKIYFTKKYGEPHLFYLFFSKYNPAKYQQNDSLVRYEKSNWRWVDRLDKIYFINDWEMKKVLENEKNALVISTPDNYPAGAQKLDTIYFLDGSKAFEIVKI